MLHPMRFGLAGGILWGVCMLVFTLISTHTNYGHQWLGMMVDGYPGYTISTGGAVIGMVYGFLDGFVGLFLLAWIYNKLGGHVKN